MLTKLKKQTDSVYAFRAVAGLVIFAGILIWTKMGIFSLILGPVKLDLKNADQMAGKYVYYEANAVLGPFSSLYKDNRLSSTSYSVFDYDTNIGFGIKRVGGATSSKHAEMEAVMDAYWDYADGFRRTMPAPVKIVGTLELLKDTPLRHYDEWWEDLEVDTVPYILSEGTVAGMDKYLLIGASAFALLSFIFSFMSVLGAVRGKFDKDLKGFLAKNPALTMGMIESDYNSAKQVGKKIWIGRRFTIYIPGVTARIIENDKLVWAYYYRQTGRNQISQVRLYDIEKNYYTLDVAEKQSQEVLKEYAKNNPRMIIGYDKKLEKCYNKDFQSFLAIKYNAPEGGSPAESESASAFTGEL